MLRKIKSVRQLKDSLCCCLSAFLLILSFPKFNIEFFAWFGFVPLFFVLQKKSKWKAFFLSYFVGIIFWVGIIYWLIHVTLPGTIVLILYLALYFGIFGLIISTIDYRLSTIDLLFIPSVWVLLEYTRSHLFTGFGWSLLGYSQYLNLPIIQIADITGVWGVSFLAMMVNVTIKEILGHRSQVTGHRLKINYKFLLMACGVLLVVCCYGFLRLNQKIQGSQLKICVIQGNIPQELKWDPKSKDFIIDKYFNLTAQAAKDKPDLIIWPEAAIPMILEEESKFSEKVNEFVKEIKIPLFFGAVTSRDFLYYNSALLVSPESRLLNRYDKLHLVPFGEYIPLKKFLPFLETVVPIGDITRGEEYTVFSQLPTPNSQLPTRFSVLICFEDLFPQISREFVKRGANFLVNITNDAWYKQTTAPYQHFQASVFRAVENRVFLVRSANTGVSGFIAPNGKVVSLVQDETSREIFIDGYKTQEIIIQGTGLTFYTRHGDIFIVGYFLLVLYGIILSFKNKR